MNTVEISERFKCQHRDVMRVVEDLYNRSIFPKGSIRKGKYMTRQSKTHACYELSDDVIRYLITSRRMFRSSHDRVLEGSKILSELNTPHKIVLGDTTRQEEKFGIALDEFFGGHLSIISQYRINGKVIDFFIPSMNIAIEFDERYHNTRTNKNLDEQRMKDIDDYILKNDPSNKITWIRVDEGLEMLGLRKVMGAILYLGKEGQLDCFGF